MLQRFFTIIFLSQSLLCYANELDTLYQNLDEVEVVSFKEHGIMRQRPSSYTLINSSQIENNNLTSIKDIAPNVPNLYIPDYGSRLTSAIYIRGVGSRINTPAVGLYVDNVSYIDKSAFDFPFYDIERIQVLRGPQGTLYGRNTMGGLLHITTRDPFEYQGTDLKLNYTIGNNGRSVALTHYHRPATNFAFSAGGYYKGNDGFFVNDYTGKKVDSSDAMGGRVRSIWRPNMNLQIDFTASFDHNNEGAYPYYYNGTVNGEEEYGDCLEKITNNHTNKYRRNMSNIGLNLTYNAKRWTLHSVTSYQHISDRMFLDQDFLSTDIFTLEQRQRINTINEEILIKSKTDKRWRRVTGANVTYQWLRTIAPVTFEQDGLSWLADNINTSMPNIKEIPMLSQMGFGNMSILFNNHQLLIESQSDTPLFGAALFHESEVEITDNLVATIGVRLDYEKQEMNFNNKTFGDASFTFPNLRNDKMSISIPSINLYNQIMSETDDDYLNLLPKISLRYKLDKYNNVYASISKGQRSGGYNVQMLSDYMQNHLRIDMINQVKDGIVSYLQHSAMPPAVIPTVENILNNNLPQFENPDITHLYYRPERTWNYELGTHLSFINRSLQIDAAAFLMDVSDQQVSRFTPSGLGRMMANVGKSRTWGAEVSICAQPVERLTLNASYGFCHATFTDYDAGNNEDYTNCRVPFVPKHTSSFQTAYNVPLKHSWINCFSFGLNTTMAGRIYWNESNSLSQPFYATLGAFASVETKKATIRVWGKNLTNSKYDTFCFESMNHIFSQKVKPIHVGIDLHIKF